MGKASWIVINRHRQAQPAYVNRFSMTFFSTFFDRLRNGKLYSSQFDGAFLLESAAVSAFLMLYVIGLLWLTDLGLAYILPGYQFSGSYGLGIIIFYLSIMVFVYWTRWRGETGWRFYVLGSLVIFFPLVFLSSSLTILFNPEHALVLILSDQYCTANNSISLCGRAFSALIFGMSLRALPTVITAPFLAWYLLTHHTSFARDRDA